MPKTPNQDSAQDAVPTPAAEAPQIIEQNGQKLALVATIKTAATNREFQNNVQVVQRQRAEAVELRRRIEQAVTTGEKDVLQKRFAEVEKSLNENNALMVKTYGFSLARNYVIRFHKTKLYTPLTDEEFAKVSPEDKAKPDAIKSIEGKVFLYIAAIDGVEANDLFRQNVQLVQNQRNRLVQIKQSLDAPGGDADAKAKLKEEFDKSEETLKKNNEEMVKLYGFSLMRNYLLEVEESQLYVALSKEEADKAAAA
ncbi:MAG: hypothetical protein LBG65_01805 [Puniceicoccales bacterium]|jgi:hypothetical protein|nr:hypothetical protein [Puniceicoccales bacterium]